MKSYLKTVKYQCTALGRDFELKELSGRAMSDMSDAKGDPLISAAIACKYSVSEWHDETAEDICENLPMDAMLEISSAILEISGVDIAKNSVAGQDEDSQSASVSH